MTFAAYSIANLKPCDIFAHFSDLAHKLVPDYQRDGNIFLCPGIPFVDMDICTADRSFMRFDQDFVIINF